MKKQLLLIGITTLILSCSSPLDKKFNEETAKEDIEAIKSKLDTTELQLMAGSMIRLKLQDEKLENMTYLEILENGKKWKKEQEKIEIEQKALAEKAAKEEAEKFKRLNEAVIVSCFEKGYTKYDYEDYITYKFIIKNKSNKKIRAVKGGITFTNLFDDEISSLSFVYDQPIEARTEANWNATTDYNQFKDEDRALKNKDLKDLKVIWKPEKIIFEDGTTLE
jgi:hypothetical protein